MTEATIPENSKNPETVLEAIKKEHYLKYRGHLNKNIVDWSTKTNIIGSGFIDGQFIKIVEEIGELAGKIARKDVPEIKDAVGDIQFILVNLTEMYGSPINSIRMPKTDGQHSDYLEKMNIARLIARIINAILPLGETLTPNGKNGNPQLDVPAFVFIWDRVLTYLGEIGRRFNFTTVEALADAWEIVKDREGIFYNRVFIKSADFTKPMLEEMLASGELPEASIEIANRYLAKM